MSLFFWSCNTKDGHWEKNNEHAVGWRCIQAPMLVRLLPIAVPSPFVASLLFVIFARSFSELPIREVANRPLKNGIVPNFRNKDMHPVCSCNGTLSTFYAVVP